MIRAISFFFWVPAALIIGIAAALPLGVESQLIFALVALAAMATIKLTGLKGVCRTIFLGLGTFVILRYLAWRFTSTIPPLDSPLDFAVGTLLLAAEAYCVIMLFLSIFTIAQPVNRKSAPHFTDEEAPTVDVFVPSYNESLDIVAPTLAAAKRMTYLKGKLNVFLLDDGGTEEKLNADDPTVAAQAKNRRSNLQALCVELGVRYLTRENNSHAKAGNLNNGLSHSDGDLVVVFDADHVPAQDFLVKTVGYFKADHNLFLLQTPHFFLNPDPIERNFGSGGMPAENEMFHGLIQKGLDKWNAAFFCGSAAVLRRRALDEIGGFHGVSVTEDAETALELHSRGWNSLYVDERVVAGLQPETFASFIGQRSRWCRGMVQILLLKNPLFLSGLTFAQRLCYLSSTLFWLFPISRMIFIVAPLLYTFFGMKIFIANSQEFVAYTLTYMASALLIQSYLFRTVRWPWVSDLYEYIQSVMLFRAVFAVLANPRAPKFNVTDKGQTLQEDRLSEMVWPYFMIFLLVAASMVVLGLRFINEPNSRDLIAVVAVWSFFNLCLTGAALGAAAEKRERRAVPRLSAQRDAELVHGAEALKVTIEDMSFGGLRVRARDGRIIPPRTTGILRIKNGTDGGAALETPVMSLGRRARDGHAGFGLKFYGVNASRFEIISSVMYADVSAIFHRRSHEYARPGILRGTIGLSALAIAQTLRGLYFILLRRNPSPSASLAPSVDTAVSPVHRIG
jgi:cellulose synthase (UDP-forming)